MCVPPVRPEIKREACSMMGETRLHGEKYHPEEVCQELIFFIVEPPYSIRAERRAIDAVIQNNPKARANPKALAQLDGYKRPLVSSLSGNLQRFGLARVAKVESLQEIIAGMEDTTETNDSADCPSPSLSARSDAQSVPESRPAH
jgi:hypothetical protein